MAYICGVVYKRDVELSRTYNVFLFGARGTGKTTLLQSLFSNASTAWYDLLDIDLEDRLSKDPNVFIQQLNALPDGITHVVIDEIQKLPKLLDLIHRFLQRNRDRYAFVLTGSSARKLKHGGANLLAGRAFVSNLFPLTYRELAEDFELQHYLSFGGLPQVYAFADTADKNRYLRAYALTYIKEEVWAEHLIKNLDPFRNFLAIAAQTNGEIVNYAKIASAVGVTTKTAQVYFDILKETHVGITLDAYHTSARKRTIQAPKFYLFDTGVKRALDNTLQVPLVEQTFAYGRAFEHFIILQSHCLNEYLQRDFQLYYLKTKAGAEIDLVVVRPDRTLLLIEIKSNTRSEQIDIRNLRALRDDIPHAQALCLSRDPIRRVEHAVEFYHWKAGLEFVFGKESDRPAGTA